MSHPNLLAGIEHGEDAGVYKLRDDLALIQTVDFFTPIVDDPYTFGKVAVANALSDVYAMGGTPLTAMNIVCFPSQEMDFSILHDILRGGLDMMREAEVLLVGGHSVDDLEIKYGLAVTGTVHPDKLLLNRGARPGDALVLTKPLGTGIINTALKAGMASRDLVRQATETMMELNRKAAEIMRDFSVHACTDITGFGLLGHACEMIEGSDTAMVIRSSQVPVFPGIREFAEMGILPAGLHRNRKYRLPMVEQDPACPEWLMDVLFDPQTSGGLFIALPAAEAVHMVEQMKGSGIHSASIVGDVVAEPLGMIRVT